MLEAKRPLLAAALLFAQACSAPEPAPAPAQTPPPAAEGLVVDDALSRRLGLELAPLEAFSRAAGVEGTGRVLSAEPLAELDAELAAARAARAGSQAALERAEGLYAAEQAGSLANVEAARREAALDAAQLDRAERRLALAWGTAAPFKDEVERKSWLERLSRGQAVLVQLELPLGTALPPAAASFEVERVAGEGRWRAQPVWPAPADAALPGPSYLALLTGSALPQPGERLRATVTSGTARAGVRIPTSALVLAEGGAWVYCEEEGHLERRALPLGEPVPGGYFVAAGFAPGEKVVVKGAGLLLALETGAPSQGGEAEED